MPDTDRWDRELLSLERRLAKMAKDLDALRVLLRPPMTVTYPGTGGNPLRDGSVVVLKGAQLG